MNIVFLIGNGFDINIGLNSRMAQFYRFYAEQREFVAQVAPQIAQSLVVVPDSAPTRASTSRWAFLPIPTI